MNGGDWLHAAHGLDLREWPPLVGYGLKSHALRKELPFLLGKVRDAG